MHFSTSPLAYPSVPRHHPLFEGLHCPGVCFLAFGGSSGAGGRHVGISQIPFCHTGYGLHVQDGAHYCVWGSLPRARILRAIILLGSYFRLFFLLLCGLGRALGFWDWVQKGLFSVGYFLSILILIHHAWIFRFCLSTLSCVCHLSALLGFFVLAKASHTMIPSRFRVLLCFALVVKMGDGRWAMVNGLGM